jgi:beta-lactam-binding protein with PASTA domain
MEFLKFLLTKVFFKNFLIAIGTGILLIITSMFWLRIYTRHGQALTVPDLTGLNLEEVQIVVDAKKLRYIVMDSVFFRELPKGSVVKQNPEPGSRVKELRTIYITLNAMNPERISMTDVTGVSLRQARAILETYGLNLGKLFYKPDIAINIVLQQMHNGKVLNPGELIVKGSSIDLVLGSGLSDETTLVPLLIGKDIRTAKNLLADRFLNIGASVFDNTVLTGEDTLLSFIWRQVPGMDEKEETRLQLGSQIDIWLTRDSTKLPQPDSLNVDQIQNVDDPNN